MSAPPFVRPSIRPSVRPFVRPAVRHPPAIRPSVHPSVHLSVPSRSSFCPSLRPSVHRPSARPSRLFDRPVRPSVPSVRPSVHPSVRSRTIPSHPVRPSVRSSVRPVRLSVRLSVRPCPSVSVRVRPCPSVRPSMRPSVRAFVHPSVRASVRPFETVICKIYERQWQRLQRCEMMYTDPVGIPASRSTEWAGRRVWAEPVGGRSSGRVGQEEIVHPIYAVKQRLPANKTCPLSSTNIFRLKTNCTSASIQAKNGVPARSVESVCRERFHVPLHRPPQAVPRLLPPTAAGRSTLISMVRRKSFHAQFYRSQ